MNVAPIHEPLDRVDWRALRARRATDVWRRIDAFELATGTMWRVVRSRAAMLASDDATPARGVVA